MKYKKENLVVLYSDSSKGKCCFKEINVVDMLSEGLLVEDSKGILYENSGEGLSIDLEKSLWRYDKSPLPGRWMHNKIGEIRSPYHFQGLFFVKDEVPWGVFNKSNMGSIEHAKKKVEKYI